MADVDAIQSFSRYRSFVRYVLIFFFFFSFLNEKRKKRENIRRNGAIRFFNRLTSISPVFSF